MTDLKQPAPQAPHLGSKHGPGRIHGSVGVRHLSALKAKSLL
jgi:hypothetical protein